MSVGVWQSLFKPWASSESHSEQIPPHKDPAYFWWKLQMGILLVVHQVNDHCQEPNAILF